MLEKILSKIKQGNMFSDKELLDLDENYVLDLRDEPEFENEWLRLSEIAEAVELSETEKTLIDKICKHSFLAVYNITASGELAGYISDDFELISKAMTIRLDDPWLNSFILSYANFKFPYGELKPTDLGIEEVIDKIIN